MTRDLRFRLLLDPANFLAGVNSSTAGLNGLQRSASSITFGELARGAVVLTGIATAAHAVASAIGSIPTKGISFLAETEVTQLGMAGILQSMTEINGQATTFAQAQAMAAGSVERLQRAAAETASSSAELVNTFRALLGPALAAGMTMEQVERLSVVGANAVKSMGLTTGQIVQEMRDLVQGGITASGSTLATSLGLKDEDIAKAKRSTEGLYAFLMQRMEGFKSTSDAYAATLKGGWEALEEQITQASARSMAPAAEAAKTAIREISQALEGPGASQALDGIGRGAASLITTLTSGIGIAQQYGGAIAGIATAYAAIKFGGMVAQFAAVTAAKSEGAAASRLAATQALLSAEADAVEAQSSRAKLAALMAEERVKVQALATEAAVTASKLRSAEATAAQLVGMQRLHAVETQVLPLRQLHAQQTAALEQAQQRLATATNATSMASRAMGSVIGALGGPVGLAITAVMLLVGSLMSARAEAEKLGKTKVSVERIEETINKGGKIDQTDASRVRSALDEAKEKRDGLLAETRKRASMYDRSKGLFGGDSKVEQRAKELASAEADVRRWEALTERVDKAQAPKVEPTSGIALRSGVSAKGLNEMLDKVKTADGIKEAGAERLKALEKSAADERALMVKRNATAAELMTFDGKVNAAKVGMQRDTRLELQSLAKKESKATGGGEAADSKAAQLEKATADLRLAQLKQSSSSRVAVLDSELQHIESLHERGLTGVEEYEEERLRIRSAKLVERMALIDEEIAAENKRNPSGAADRTRRDQRVVELITERNGLTTDIKAGESGSAASGAARALARDREMAAETAQVWQTANSQITQLRSANSQAAIGLITDPVARMRAETAAQVTALQASAGELTQALQIKLSVTTDPGQRDMLATQIKGIADETGRAVELANSGLAEKLKPGWQQMLEGWRDTNRLMREASDQTMQGLISKGEDAFVSFVKTGKLSIKSLADDWIATIARTEFRKFVGGLGAGGDGGGGSLWGTIAKGVVGLMGGGAAANADGAVFTGATRFAAGGAFTNSIVDRPTNFRFSDRGRERLGLMGEAGPEAIMPLSGGGALAIGADGRSLGHVPVRRGPGGRLSVVVGGRAAFAAGDVFGPGASAQLKAAGTAAGAASGVSVDASTTLHVTDMARVQQMVTQSGMDSQRRIIEHLKAMGVMR